MLFSLLMDSKQNSSSIFPTSIMINLLASIFPTFYNILSSILFLFQMTNFLAFYRFFSSSVYIIFYLFSSLFPTSHDKLSSVSYFLLSDDELMRERSNIKTPTHPKLITLHWISFFHMGEACSGLLI